MVYYWKRKKENQRERKRLALEAFFGASHFKMSCKAHTNHRLIEAIMSIAIFDVGICNHMQDTFLGEK
jgi:hypothetical protein